jgi:hypothetical protein
MTEKECTNCYSKGYSTRAYQEHGAADFIGDKSYTSELREEKIPCKKCSIKSHNTTADRFRGEFGIHFKDCPDELEFAIAFIEDEVDKAVQAERDRIAALLYTIDGDEDDIADVYYKIFNP